MPAYTMRSSDCSSDVFSSDLWLGNSWGVFFSHPKNFTPVCTTELGEVARLKPEWDKRGVKPIGLSVDPVDAHNGWDKDIEETQGHKLNFPMIADDDKKVSALYEMIHPDSDPTYTVRAVYVIDPNKKIRLILTYPPSAGRNFAEILRAINSLQLTDGEKVSTPVNWEPGQPVIIRSEEHTSELQSLMRISYAVFCLNKKKEQTNT